MPISLLTILFSKIFEKAIKIRLVNYLGENQLISSTQFGFRKGLGTEDVIKSLTHTISEIQWTQKKKKKSV